MVYLEETWLLNKDRFVAVCICILAKQQLRALNARMQRFVMIKCVYGGFADSGNCLASLLVLISLQLSD